MPHRSTWSRSRSPDVRSSPASVTQHGTRGDRLGGRREPLVSLVQSGDARARPRVPREARLHTRHRAAVRHVPADRSCRDTGDRAKARCAARRDAPRTRKRRPGTTRSRSGRPATRTRKASTATSSCSSHLAPRRRPRSSSTRPPCAVISRCRFRAADSSGALRKPAGSGPSRTRGHPFRGTASSQPDSSSTRGGTPSRSRTASGSENQGR
jgi:hypothetical protein